jgi:hypothetical protein
MIRIKSEEWIKDKRAWYCEWYLTKEIFGMIHSHIGCLPNVVELPKLT